MSIGTKVLFPSLVTNCLRDHSLFMAGGGLVRMKGGGGGGGGGVTQNSGFEGGGAWKIFQ